MPLICPDTRNPWISRNKIGVDKEMTSNSFVSSAESRRSFTGWEVRLVQQEITSLMEVNLVQRIAKNEGKKKEMIHRKIVVHRLLKRTDKIFFPLEKNAAQINTGSQMAKE